MTQRTLSPDRVGETEKRPRAVLLLTSGRRLDLLNPDPQAWTEEALAAGLARTLRSWRRVAMGPPAQCRSAQPDRARHPRGRRPALCGRGLRELLHDAAEFMLGWDCIAPLKPQLGEPFRILDARLQAAVDARYRLPAWTPEACAKHKRADRLAAASEAIHVVGWSLTDLRRTLGIEIAPLLDDPLAPRGFAPWEPWPPRVAQRLFMERLRPLLHAHRSSLAASGPPADAEDLCPLPNTQGVDCHVLRF